MKTLLFTCTSVAVILVIALGWWQDLRQEGAALAAQRSALGTAPAPPKSAERAKAVVKKPDPLSAILSDIAVEQAALEKLKQQTGALAARLPASSGDELIVSFGRIEDMGRDTGAGLKIYLRMAEPNQGDRETEEHEILKFMQIKGRIPEIQDFENNPAEIARFQSHALQEALGLSSATEAAVRPLIREAFAGMAAQGLTARQRPATQTKAWTEKRGEALRQLMLKLRPHIPDSEGPAARQALTFILNLGAGLETRHYAGPRQSSFTIGVHWPKVPW